MPGCGACGADLTGRMLDGDRIRAILFDLDGTLYVDRELSREIHLSACRYIAGVLGIMPAEAEGLLRETKDRLYRRLGYLVSLTRTCMEVGGDVPGLHRHLCGDIVPEDFLGRDNRVAGLLERLGSRYRLYLYTNNNLCLAGRIMRCIGIEGMFRRVFTIEDSWRPKPDRDVLEKMLVEIGSPAEECLFVGDRFDVDLMIPEEMGAQVYLSTSVDMLLQLESMIRRRQ